MNKTILITVVLLATAGAAVNAQDANKILADIDNNMSAKTTIMESTMIVHGKRNDRTMTSKSYGQGKDKGFSEYLSPVREKGTKMLKLGKEMWIYSPTTDRTIMISGHLLRQSVMGSDMSYEDMLDDRKLTDVYNASITGQETLNGVKCYVMQLTAKVSDAAYPVQKIWVEIERLIPLKEQLCAKSGQILKQVTLSNFQRIQGRWYPMKMNYKDMLKDGNGTDWIISKIEFDKTIPDYIFSKAGLKK
jgi:outer membrane lipoprotein-sorting protein